LDILLNQERYWDKVSDAKEFTTPFQINAFKNYASRESKILDVGCGYGRTLNELHEWGFKNLFGVDFSQGMIEGRNFILILICKRAKGNFLLITTPLTQFFY
jgi:SAM-dependent methyltransferase